MNNRSLATKVALLLVVLSAASFGVFRGADFSQAVRPAHQSSPLSEPSTNSIEQAFKQRLSNIQVRVRGSVIKLLPDDRDGSRHQRFLIRLDSGQTLLVAHNIDLAPRVKGLAVNDMIEIHGEYEWNEKGGVIHWTHQDPRGHHPDGWISYQGRLYQ